jgi:hypothetical protein
MWRRVGRVRIDISQEKVAGYLLLASCCSRIIFTLTLEARSEAEIWVLRRPTRRHVPEDDILRSLRHENLKSYIALTGWTL